MYSYGHVTHVITEIRYLIKKCELLFMAEHAVYDQHTADCCSACFSVGAKTTKQ